MGFYINNKVFERCNTGEMQLVLCFKLLLNTIDIINIMDEIFILIYIYT